jgi:hypothetical protein
MKRFMIRMGICAAIGAVLGVVGVALHIPLGVLLGIVFVGALAWPRICVRYVAPRRARRLFAKLEDPDWRPPAAAVPATSPLLDRMGELLAAGDRRGLLAILAEDFAMVDFNGRRHGKARYLRAIKASKRMFRESKSEDDVLLTDPARREVFYLRSTQTGRPVSGPPLHYTLWMRITLASCGERVREISTDAITHVG